MLRFTVQNFQLTLDEHALGYAEFKAIVDADKDPRKQSSIQDLLYVYYMNDEESSFAGVSAEAKPAMVNRSVYKDAAFAPTGQRLARRALAEEFYREMNETIEGRLLASLDRRIERVREFIDSNDQPIASKQDLKDQVEMAGEVQQLIDKRAKLKETIAKSGKTKVRTKGDAVSSPNEKGLFDYKKVKSEVRLRRAVIELDADDNVIEPAEGVAA